MKPKVTIDATQAGTLIAVTILGTMFITLPQKATSDAGLAGWISVLVGFLVAVAMAVALVKLAARFPEQTVIEYSRTLLGNLLGSALGLTFVAALGFMCAMLIREFAEVFTTIVLPNTPISVFILLFSGTVVYAAYGGLPTIARLAQLWFPLVFLSLLALLALSAGEFDAGHLRPLQGPGIAKILEGSWMSWAVFGEALILLWLYPFLRQKELALKAVWAGTAVAAFLLIIVTIGIVGALGATSVAAQTFPVLAAVRIIAIGGFLERLESVFMVMWFVAAFLKVVTIFWASSLGLAQLLRLPSYKPLILPLAALYVIISIIPQNIREVFSGASESVEKYGHVFGYLLPLFLLALAVIARKGGARHVRS